MHQVISSRPAALVTGGAVRLGKALALALAKAGYDIALHYHRSHEAAESTAAEIRTQGVECTIFAADLSQYNELNDLLPAVKTAFPRLEVLINSASGYIQANIATTRLEDFDTLFAVNLRAPFFLSAVFAQQVEHGAIVNIVDNKIGFNQFQYAAYLLSKKALAEFTRMAALEFAPHIRVNGVAPGIIAPMPSRSPEYMQWRIQGIPVGHKGKLTHITDTVLYLLQNDFVNGQVWVVDGGENISQTGRNAGAYDPSKV